jgi:hypothetical protein
MVGDEKLRIEERKRTCKRFCWSMNHRTAVFDPKDGTPRAWKWCTVIWGPQKWRKTQSPTRKGSRRASERVHRKDDLQSSSATMLTEPRVQVKAEIVVRIAVGDQKRKKGRLAAWMPAMQEKMTVRNKRGINDEGAQQSVKLLICLIWAAEPVSFSLGLYKARWLSRPFFSQFFASIRPKKAYVLECDTTFLD